MVSIGSHVCVLVQKTVVRTVYVNSNSFEVKVLWLLDCQIFCGLVTGSLKTGRNVN